MGPGPGLIMHCVTPSPMAPTGGRESGRSLPIGYFKFEATLGYRVRLWLKEEITKTLRVQTSPKIKTGAIPCSPRKLLPNAPFSTVTVVFV